MRCTLYATLMIEWKISQTPIPYPRAMTEMEQRARDIRDHGEAEMIWLLEHPACYTAGTSAREIDLIDHNKYPVYQTGRGGQYTYHGPGQRIAYVIMDIQKRGINIRDYVCKLEKWIITALGKIGIRGELRDGRIGVWVAHDGTESKIAALGVRVSRGVAFHGLSININPDLADFQGIIPCGISQYGVTSIAALGKRESMTDVDKILQQTFDEIFIPISTGCDIIGA